MSNVNDNASPIVERWIATLRAEGKSNRTIRERRTIMRRFERDAGTPALAATTEQIADWLGRDDLATVTKSAYHSVMKNFYAWCLLSQLREDHPMATIRAARRPRRQPRPITRKQFDRLVDGAAGDRVMLAMILLHGLAGLRVHEIARFQSRHLDVEGRTIEVTGKGGATYVLPAHPMIVEIARWMPRGYWFPSQRARHLGGRTVTERIHLHMLRCKVPGTPHCLRHFYGTQLVESGADLRVVQELMRHSSLATTAIYTAVSDVRKREAIERLAS
ncbi:tyrosine-type recombinase/integrase [Gordonia sp. N1V]|uniref:tyrosine-type recombinase/integrase n=1 Tax=Gordonia sp. N1V TaxID=3034163 RepID=UPI0023E2F5DB|nr:tyrosine-type recombinase/integrase [Gordonia sp. N1V]MDF3280942.1 tyrosine-type recombinase/integrase [Gordonia sp. N1V]